jgi:hypothetical protein
VRHSYETAGRNARIDWKALSKRIGDADVAFTMKQYVQTDLEADREVANTPADLIVGGLLATDEVDGRADEDQGDEADVESGDPGDPGDPARVPCPNPCTNTSQRPGSLFENRA